MPKEMSSMLRMLEESGKGAVASSRTCVRTYDVTVDLPSLPHRNGNKDTLKMARRGAPANAVPSFAPQIQPRRAAHDPDESAFSRFLREQIWAPEKLSGNISIVTGVGMFIGGIVRWTTSRSLHLCPLDMRYFLYGQAASHLDILSSYMRRLNLKHSAPQLSHL
ncbi:hypothetical protein AB1N83_002627 [Pleurotus pulmonarius]